MHISDKDSTPAGMVWIDGGAFRMGSEKHHSEEAPTRSVSVDGFWIDSTPVTNLAFTRFVAATGYMTVAERPLEADKYPGVAAHMLVPGSLTFEQPRSPTSTENPYDWWQFTPGAHWRCPYGAGSTIDSLSNHPVVHIAYEDAMAYATWMGKVLPTEAEWEFAARGGIDGATYAWGDEFSPDGRIMANIWQGEFPWQNLKQDGYDRTSPVGEFAPNGHGLFDMSGNVWEWTQDWYVDQPRLGRKNCCSISNPRGPEERASYDASDQSIAIPRKVLKGGSFLCAPEYCDRFRPAARQPQMVDTGACHIGFRCVAKPLS
ncbi:formylglycine-generating enzyme family protein [Cupriavidus sp. 2SB]|uniref:formylglycine-generating enzyme family protein n=1 Tax=Cupriavidus sp. 2SB TaxID=2502199 RepID=UPI001BB2ACAC|nr:formylglycine-generating enzyme family protein [Cupriavidus sp. 2SB]